MIKTICNTYYLEYINNMFDEMRILKLADINI